MTKLVRAGRAAAATFLTLLLSPMYGGGPARADDRRDAQWYLAALRLDAAHRVSEGAGVTVAVLDTGVQADQPDLRGAVLAGFNAVGSGDGRTDNRGHGTAMAAIVAARGRSGDRGLLGIAPAAKILPVGPATSPLAAIDSIKWAVAHGAKVINMSVEVADDSILAATITEAAAADVVLVAATANDGKEGLDEDFPAAYPEVLAVGATDRDGKIASFSHRGPQLDLVAPGVDMVLADARGGYSVGEGTSAATAIVSGAAALIRSKYPALSAADVVRILESTAIDRGPSGRDDGYGHGELDIMAALEAAAKVKPSAPVASASAAPRVIAGSPDDSNSSRLAITGIGVLVILGGLGGVLFARRRRS